MSDSGAERTEGAEREALSRLEELVGRLLESRSALAQQAQEADERVRELERVLEKFSAENVDPATLHAQLETLRDQNESLRARIAEGKEGVDKLLSRLSFLESQS